MKAKICLKNLNHRERKAWRMRYRRRRRIRQIARTMGMSASGVSKMLQRALAKLGFPKCRVSVIRTKPRTVRARHLSQVREPV